MSYRVKNIKNANFNPRKIAYFLKFAKMYTRNSKRDRDKEERGMDAPPLDDNPTRLETMIKP